MKEKPVGKILWASDFPQAGSILSTKSDFSGGLQGMELAAQPAAELPKPDVELLQLQMTDVVPSPVAAEAAAEVAHQAGDAAGPVEVFIFTLHF